jgi:hypothetical protein
MSINIFKFNCLYYKHFYGRKLTALKIVNVVACTINMITIIIDESMIVNDTSKVVKYAPRVTPLFGASL